MKVCNLIITYSVLFSHFIVSNECIFIHHLLYYRYVISVFSCLLPQSFNSLAFETSSQQVITNCKTKYNQNNFGSGEIEITIFIHIFTLHTFTLHIKLRYSSCGVLCHRHHNGFANIRAESSAHFPLENQSTILFVNPLFYLKQSKFRPRGLQYIFVGFFVDK